MRGLPTLLLVAVGFGCAGLSLAQADRQAAAKCISCRYTAAELVKDYFPNKGVRYSLHEEAWAYIDGVYNATEGREWCYPKVKERINRDELAGDAAAALKALPADVQKGAAAPLIVAYFRNKFPCGGLP